MDGEYHIKEDMLSDEDWQEICELKDVLAPFKDASKRLEGAGDGGSFGTLWEALVCLEMILSSLEVKKEELGPHSTPHLKACVNMAWKKIDDYYRRSDSTPAYRLAVALHPCLRFHWFKKHWKNFQQWQDDAYKIVKDAYSTYRQRFANHKPPAPPSTLAPARNLSAIDALCVNLIDDEDATSAASNEFDRYFNALPEKDARTCLYNPLRWWKEHAEAYPILSRMAFDHLACPATSCDTERIFSLAANYFSGERNRLSDEVGEEQMVLASWLRADVLDLQGLKDGDILAGQ